MTVPAVTLSGGDDGPGRDPEWGDDGPGSDPERRDDGRE